MLFVGPVSNEISVDVYNCLDNRDKLPTFSFVDLKDWFESESVCLAVIRRFHSRWQILLFLCV